jgi:hypothetical protein
MTTINAEKIAYISKFILDLRLEEGSAPPFFWKEGSRYFSFHLFARVWITHLAKVHNNDAKVGCRDFVVSVDITILQKELA